MQTFTRDLRLYNFGFVVEIFPFFLSVSKCAFQHRCLAVYSFRLLLHHDGLWKICCDIYTIIL